MIGQGSNIIVERSLVVILHWVLRVRAHMHARCCVYVLGGRVRVALLPCPSSVVAMPRHGHCDLGASMTPLSCVCVLPCAHARVSMLTQPNEHVVYDYAFTETEASLHAGLHCKCGAPECRKVCVCVCVCVRVLVCLQRLTIVLCVHVCVCTCVCATRC
jgi:hypothetical protein